MITRLFPSWSPQLKSGTREANLTQEVCKDAHNKSLLLRAPGRASQGGSTAMRSVPFPTAFLNSYPWVRIPSDFLQSTEMPLNPQKTVFPITSQLLKS